MCDLNQSFIIVVNRKHSPTVRHVYPLYNSCARRQYYIAYAFDRLIMRDAARERDARVKWRRKLIKRNDSISLVVRLDV